MNHVIWAVGLCLLLSSAGCSLADAPRDVEASAPAPAAARVDAVSLVFPAVVDAGTWAISGKFQFDPSPDAAPPALPAVLEVRDSSGTTVARLETSTDKPIAMPLPQNAAGLLTVTATVTGAAEESLTASAQVFAGTLAALGPVAADAERSLRSRLAAADGAERRDLERQLTVARFARVWLDTERPQLEKAHLPALAYITRMLPVQAAGRDYMLEARGSNLALLEHPDLEWGGVTHTRFWVHLPADYESRTDWPVVFFLHGMTSATFLVESFRSPTAAFPGGVGMPCVGITPKSEIQGGWEPDILNRLLDHVLAHYNVDPDRVSVVGHSRGAAGTLAWAMHSPQRIAAIAPTAGTGNLLEAYKIAHIPAWFVHGLADNAGRSIRMSEWLRRCGAEPRLTLIPGGGHMDTFSELEKPEFWTWMASHRRTQPPSGLEAPAFGQDGLTRVERGDLPAQRLLHAGATGGTDAPPAQFNESLERRLYEAACGAGLACGTPMVLIRPGAEASEVSAGILVRGAADVPERLHVTELPAARCARVLYRGPADSLADTCGRLREQLRAEGARPTGELRCLYWGTRGRRGASEGVWELVFTLE